MKKIFFVALFLTVAVSLAFAGSGFPCSLHREMLNDVLARKQQAFLATAIARQGIVLQFFASPGHGFSVIGVGADGQSCLLLSGSGWLYAAERKS